MRVLIAEDDSTSRVLLSGALEKWGYDPLETADGNTAWSILGQPEAPLLVILDWVMPGMDGMEVLRRVRTLDTDHPPYVLILTSKQGKKDIIAALDAGANDYLVKPFDPDELRARVQVGRRMIELQEALTAKITELRRALDQIRTLRGIVPICMSCKKIRDDQGYWKQVEAYVRDHTEAEFSHGLCPECMKNMYPDFDPNRSKE